MRLGRPPANVSPRICGLVTSGRCFSERVKMGENRGSPIAFATRLLPEVHARARFHCNEALGSAGWEQTSSMRSIKSEKDDARKSGSVHAPKPYVTWMNGTP